MCKVEIQITDENKRFLERLVKLGKVNDLNEAINKVVYNLRKSSLKSKIENKDDTVNLI